MKKDISVIISTEELQILYSILYRITMNMVCSNRHGYARVDFSFNVSNGEYDLFKGLVNKVDTIILWEVRKVAATPKEACL